MAEFLPSKSKKDKKTKVDVYPVSVMDMGGGYGNGESYSSGTVTDDKSQVIYLEDSDKVAEVYVKEGDKVKEGDPLMRYDMEEANLNVDMKTLDVENAENDLVIAQRELEKLKNMTPVAETPTVPDEPEEPAPKPEVPKKTEMPITSSENPRSPTKEKEHRRNHTVFYVQRKRM